MFMKRFITKCIKSIENTFLTKNKLLGTINTTNNAVSKLFTDFTAQQKNAYITIFVLAS